MVGRLVSLMAVITAAAAVPPAAAEVATKCDSAQRCQDSMQYCDSYEGRCKQCSELCLDNFKECHDRCESYLQGVLFTKSTNNEENYKLTVLIAFNVAMTSAALICLLLLVFRKLGKRSRVQKSVFPSSSVFTVQKEKCELEMKRNSLPFINVGRNYVSSADPSQSRVGNNGGPSADPSRGPIRQDLSVYTVSTQLSDNSEGEKRPMKDFSAVDASSSTQGKLQRRLPSEDCVSTGRCNPGLEHSPCTSSNQLSVSHSEVV